MFGHSMYLVVFGFGLGGSLLALLCLMLEHWRAWGGHVQRAASFGLLTAGGAALLCLEMPPELQLISLLTASVGSVGSLAYSGRLRAAAQVVLNGRLIWMATLLACPTISLLLARSAASPPAEEVGLELVDKQVFTEVAAVSDCGRPIELFRYSSGGPTAEEAAVLASPAFRERVIRVAGPSADTNCHGWVFTGGRFGVSSNDVPGLLIDNGYSPVVDPRPGDLIIYTSDSGAVTHTGLVCGVARDGQLLVESKWGALGVYIHPDHVQPYGHQRHVYRSGRTGHQIALETGARGPARRIADLGRTADPHL